MPNLFILTICCFCINFAFAQEMVYYNTASEKVLKNYNRAQAEYRNGQLQQAKKLFSKLVQQSPFFIDARIQLGSVFFELKNYQEAEVCFEKAIQLDSFYKIKIFYTLALTQYRLEKFHAAKANMEVFLSRESSNLELLSKAEVLYKNLRFSSEALSHKKEIKQKLIEAFSSNYSEYMPCVEADGKRAYFTRRTPLGDEDIYVVDKLDTGWSVPIPLAEVNTHLNEGSPSISANGKLLVFTSCDRIDRIGGCDLYYSEYDGQGWSAPRNLGDQINTPAYESQACITNNGRTIYFVSNRKGTLGGYDIWVTQKKQDGKWSTPKNLGATINSTGDDVSPFMHSNGMSLYFASDGHTGVGGKDLFISSLDTNYNWSPVINLGLPINSIGDESSWIVLPDGKTAWMASDQEYLRNSSGKPNLDLFEIELPESMQIVPSTYVKLRIYDKKSKTPVPAEVKIFNLNTQKLIVVQNADAHGEILFSLPTGFDYAIQVMHDLYNFYADQFLCSEARSVFQPFKLNIELTKIADAKNTSVVLRNIFFESGSDVLLQESKFELDALYKILKINNSLNILIEAHSDNVGTDGDNQILSERRAQAVVHYLINKGITASRLQAKGFGESRPEASNETADGRRLNRRIVFTIIE